MNEDPRTASELAATYESQIKGKIVLTTGVSPGGLGAAFVLGIAQSQPALLILAGRNLAKVQQTADAISATGVKMAVDWAQSAEGYDSQLVVNHLGPFLFTNLIMGKLLKSPAPRIVNVTSGGHRLSPFRFEDYNFRNGEYYHKWLSYGQSKTANMLMAISLAEKLGRKHNLSAFSVHPGVVPSNLSSHLKLFGEDDSDMISMRDIDRVMGNGVGWTGFGDVLPSTPEVGANVYVYGAFDPDVTSYNGAFLLSCRLADPNNDTVRPWATSSVEAERLWKLSEKLVGQIFPY